MSVRLEKINVLRLIRNFFLMQLRKSDWEEGEAEIKAIIIFSRLKTKIKMYMLKYLSWFIILF